MESGADEGDLPPGTVKVSPEKQQMIGVRVGLAERKGTTHTFGPSEELPRMRTGFTVWSHPLKGGWSISRGDDGDPGGQGPAPVQNLQAGDILNRDMVSGQQVFFLALNTLDRKKADHVPRNS